MPREKRKALIFFLLVAVILSLDRLTKFLVIKNLPLNKPFALIKGVFYLTHVHNRGAAFGILKNQVPLFIFISIFAVILICFNLKNLKEKKFFIYNLSLVFILAGALGNLIDRIFFGYVIDFLDFRVWPVFNIADSSITVGMILLGWSILITGNRQS